MGFCDMYLRVIPNEVHKNSISHINFKKLTFLFIIIFTRADDVSLSQYEPHEYNGLRAWHEIRYAED